MNKDKMFLVSAENIVHDISGRIYATKQVIYLFLSSGLANFESNLLSQIESQDQIIQTLKNRLESAEKQEKSIAIIVDSLKASDRTRQRELKETKDLLEYSREKIYHLENITVQQIKKVHDAESDIQDMKLALKEKDNIIADLKRRLEHGEQAEEINFLKEEISICNKQKANEVEIRRKMEETMSNLEKADKVRNIVRNYILNSPMSLTIS